MQFPPLLRHVRPSVAHVSVGLRADEGRTPLEDPQAPGFLRDGSRAQPAGQGLTAPGRTLEDVRTATLHLTGNPDRAAMAAELMAGMGSLSDLLPHAAILIRAAGTPRDRRDGEGLVPPLYGVRALERMQSLDTATRARVDDILRRAGSWPEQATLLKAIAGSTSFDNPESLLADLDKLAGLIRGRSLDWLFTHTSGYAIRGGEGFHQPHLLDDRCGLFVYLVALLESQPLLAIEMSTAPGGRNRRDGPALRFTASEAARSRALHPEANWGTRLDDYIEGAAAPAGAAYARLDDWSSASRKQKLERLDLLETALKLGLDVPVTEVGDLEQFRRQRGGSVPGHDELIVDCVRRQGHRLWRVYEPATGRTRLLSDERLVSGRMRWFGQHAVALYAPYLPSPPDPAADAAAAGG